MSNVSPLSRIKSAHMRSGAPGYVIGFRGDGYYRVRLQYGERWFRFHSLPDGRVKVMPSWQIDGTRQRKQATA